MQMVVAGCGRRKLRGIVRVTRRSIHINHAVKLSARPYPAVDGLAHSLPGTAEIERTPVGHDRRSIDADMVRMRPKNDLLISLDYLPDSCRASSDIIDSLEHNQPAHGGLRQNVTIQPRQSVRTQAVMQQAVAADPFIQHANACGGSVCLQPAGEIVRPASISVGRRTVSIRNGIPTDGHRRTRIPDEYINAVQKIPVIRL